MPHWILALRSRKRSGSPASADATGTGTIVDDDSSKPTVTRVEPGQPGLADDATPEGSNLVYTVGLSEPTQAPATYPFTLGGGETLVIGPRIDLRSAPDRAWLDTATPRPSRGDAP